MTMTVYKVLDDEGYSQYGRMVWPRPTGTEPGEWVDVTGRQAPAPPYRDKPILCSWGLHGYLHLEHAKLQRMFDSRRHHPTSVYEMELDGSVDDGSIVKDGEKAASLRARLVRLVWPLAKEWA